MKLYLKVVQFLIYFSIHNWQKGLNNYAFMYLYPTTKVSRISLSNHKCFEDSGYDFVSITIHIRKLGFKRLRDAQYGFSLWRGGEQAL